MTSSAKPYLLLERILVLPPERIIAFARCVLTVFALVASVLDPPGNRSDAQLIYIVVSGYVAFAILSACVVAVRPPRHWEQIVAHTIDITCVCLLMHFNQGPNSPFFIFFTFILLSATLRWGWRGTIRTTVLLILVFLMLILMVGIRPLASEIGELSRSIVRPAYLVVAGLMLSYVSALQERSRAQLARLAAWPGPDYDQDVPIPIKSALEHAAAIMQSPRVLVIWEPLDEPFHETVLWSQDGLEYSRESPGRFGDLVAAPLVSSSFAPSENGTSDLSVHAGAILCGSIDQDLQQTFSIEKAISASFSFPACRGRVFLLDTDAKDQNDVVLANLIATRIGIDIEHYCLRSELEEVARSKEREGLARDLHDGVLQGLAAANIHLKLGSEQTADCAADHLAQTRHILAAEQQRIRAFVENNRSHLRSPSGCIAVAPDVNRLLEHLGQQWGCHVDVSIEPADLQIAVETARNLRHFLAEALSNAVRHGKASQVNVSIRVVSGRLRLTVSDNGRGFKDLLGTYSGEELFDKNAGPLSLRTRAEDMGGTITLQTSPSGTEVRVEISL